MLTLYNINDNSFVTALSLSKRFRFMKLEVSSSFSNLNDKTQIQPNLSVFLFPFGNSTLYSKTSVNYQIQKSAGITEYNPFISQSIGFKFLKYFWIEPLISYGRMVNYTERDAFIVNNDIDITSFRFENMLNISLNKTRFNIFFLYRYNIKENIYKLNSNEITQNYINQSIIGGIKWYF